MSEKNTSEDLKQAIIFIKQKKINKASKLLQKILINNRHNFEANFFYGTLAAQNNDLETALRYLKIAVSINTKSHDAFNNLGLISLRQGNNSDAVKYFESAVKLKPDFSLALCNLGLAYSNLKNIDKAFENFKKSHEVNPSNYLAYYNIGNLKKRLGEIKTAENFLLKSIEIQKNYFPAYNNLLELYDKSNQDDKLLNIINRAEIEFKDNDIIKLFKSKLLYKSKNFKEIINILSKINFENDNLQEQTKQELLAKSYDQLRNFEKAFLHFEKANNISHLLNNYKADKNIFIDQVEKKIKFFSKPSFKGWSKTNFSFKKKNPVFLIGFPRSGTTLLDTILRSHNSIRVLEEKPIVDRFVEKLNELINFDLNNLDKINEKTFNDMFNTYFNYREEYLKTNEDNIYIDKMPLNIVYVGELMKFFPDAKFILAIRNPYDCVMSCYMQNFQLNHAMANFLSIDDTSKTYNLVMSLWKKYFDIFKIKCHQIRYEDLIGDFKTSVDKLLGFLELPWSDDVLKFYETASKRGIINTPSYNQVSQPIYSSSINRWKNYEDKFENSKTILDKWAKEFGY